MKAAGATIFGVLVCAGTLLAAPAGTLTANDVDDAIRLGETGQPAPYLLHNKQGPETVNPGVMAVVYTPFVRVALAAKAAWDVGRHLEKDNIPPPLLEPAVWIAFRWYCCVDQEHGDRWNWHPRTPPFNYEIATPASERWAGLGENIATWPMWVTRDVWLLDALGRAPYSDIVLIAGYPLSALSQPSDFVIYNHVPNTVNPAGPAVGSIRGRITSADIRSWR